MSCCCGSSRCAHAPLHVHSVPHVPHAPRAHAAAAAPQTSGKRWKLIAEALGHANPRTPAMVRNRYLRIEKGRSLTERGMSKNRCGQCGELKRGHMCRAGRRPGMADAPSPNLMEVISAHHRLANTPEKASSSLMLGAPALTMAFNADDGTGVGHLASPGPLSRGQLSLGLSPLATNTPNGGVNHFASLSGGLPSLHGGPPALRPQNSMDILLQASDLHRIQADQETPAPTLGNFDTNPFKLPTVRARR